MNSTETKSSCTRELQIEIPAEVVVRETETLLGKYQKLARVPGFRKGKVPVSVVRQRFGEELKSELVEELVPKYFFEEARKQGLSPVSEPRVSDLHIHEGEPLRFKASFEVLPDIEVSGYEELRPEIAEITVGADEVDKALENLREQQATYTPIEGRGLQDGDYAQVAFTGAPELAEGAAEPGKPVKVDDVLVEIGGSNTVKEFTENLRGAQAGDERAFPVNYPSDFADQRLAGRNFSYAVSVKGIKEKRLPELNDEFARQVGDFENLEALRQRIQEGIKAEKEHDAEHVAKEKIVDALAERHSFPVPEALVERQIELRLARGARALAAQGMRLEDIKKMDFSRFRAGQRDSAEKEVKVALLLDRIAELEKIEVSDEEVDREIEALAVQMRQPAEEVRARLTQDGALSRIRSRLRNEKTLDFLYRKPA